MRPCSLHDIVTPAEKSERAAGDVLDLPPAARSIRARAESINPPRSKLRNFIQGRDRLKSAGGAE